MLDVDVGALLDDLGDPLQALGKLVFHEQLVFHPVGILLEAQALHVVVVIWVVVNQGHGAEAVVARD